MSLINDPNVGILCPQSMSPVAPAHAERVALLNRIYEQMERDTDGESPAEQERLYRAADGDGDWMRLYVEHKGTPVGGRYVSITVAFYRCQVCGFTLPVTAEDRP
jgi:hypothetical protein